MKTMGHQLHPVGGREGQQNVPKPGQSMQGVSINAAKVEEQESLTRAWRGPLYLSTRLNPADPREETGPSTSGADRPAA